MSLAAKKVDYDFEEPLNLHTIAGQLFFRCGFQENTERQAEDTI